MNHRSASLQVTRVIHKIPILSTTYRTSLPRIDTENEEFVFVVKLSAICFPTAADVDFTEDITSEKPSLIEDPA